MDIYGFLLCVGYLITFGFITYRLLKSVEGFLVLMIIPVGLYIFYVLVTTLMRLPIAS